MREKNRQRSASDNTPSRSCRFMRPASRPAQAEVRVTSVNGPRPATPGILLSGAHWQAQGATGSGPSAVGWFQFPEFNLSGLGPS
jgi:hypothetical protein